MDAIEKTAEYRAGGITEEQEDVSEVSQNEASLAQLQMMMQGVK